MGIDGLKVDEINSKVPQYWSVIVTEETGSTQIDLAENFIAQRVLVAEYQSAGRGRLDRKFEVPAKQGLTFSFAITDKYFPNNANLIPLITGLAVANAINKYASTELVTLKWPNDLMIKDEKLGGILSQRVPEGFVVGVGINVYQSKSELPIPKATSLALHLEQTEIDRSRLFIGILLELDEQLNASEATRSKQINNYRELCRTIGQNVSATLPDGKVVEDLAIGISEDGSLLLRSREIRVADIVHLR